MAAPDIVDGVEAGSGAVSTSPTQDHYHDFEGNADDTGTATAINGTATGGVSYVAGDGGQAARIGNGEEISLGTAAAIKTDNTVRWKKTLRFSAAAGAGTVVIFARLGASYISGDKQFFLDSAGRFNAAASGSTTATCTTNLRDGAYHTVIVEKISTLLVITVDGVIEFAGVISWAADSVSPVLYGDAGNAHDSFDLAEASYELV